MVVDIYNSVFTVTILGGHLDIIKDEKGLVFGIVIIIVATLLLILSLLAILNHNWIMFVVFFLVACFVYPITSRIKDRFFT